MIKSSEQNAKVPPDGGWGWIIVVAYAICNIILAPSVTNFGLIFKDKFADMKMPAADISFIMNINSAFAMSLGLINGPLIRYFGYRKVGVAAGLLVTLGMCLTAFANSFGAFVFTYGIITAAGFGFAISAFSLALNSYFRVKRNKAAGISMTITGLGPIIYPPMVSVLLSYYGVTGCVLILGGLCTHIIMAALLLQPIKWHMINAPTVTDVEPSPPDNPSLCFSRQFSQSEYSAVLNPGAYDTKQNSIFEVNHEIDTQSIYGWEQMPLMRRPSQIDRQVSVTAQSTVLPHQGMMRPNVSRAELRRPFMERSISHVVARMPKTEEEKPAKRWFESGSVDSIHLSSSVEIFGDKVGDRESKKSSMFPANAMRIVEKEQEILDKLEETKSETDALNEKNEKRDLENAQKHKSQSFGARIVKFFDLNLLKDYVYVNIMVGMSLAIFAEINFSVLTPFIFSDLNYSTTDIASLMSTLAVADIVSRFVSPFIGDYFKQTPRIMYMISLTLLMITRMSVFAVTSYKGMLVVCLFLGISKGIRTVYMTLVIPTYVPIERLASASGLQMVTNGLFLLILGPVVGVIRDVTGSYSKCIIFINIITLLALIMWTIEIVYKQFNKVKTIKKVDK